MISVSSPTSHAEMIAADKARKARFAAAARNAANRPKLAPPVNLARKRFVTQRMPLWMIKEIQFDDHAWAYVRWKINRTAKVRNYIRQRCVELCVSFTDITCGGRSRSIVPFRDKIIHEIKTKVDPEISWSSLARHFGLDHSSAISAHRRGAASAGDQTAAERVMKQRERANRRYQSTKARRA